MSHRRAFSMIELLVVISIITLLISMLMPSLAKSRRAAHDATDLSNQRQIINAILAYSGDHIERLPMSGRTWPHMGMLDLYEFNIRSYMSGDMNLLKCPIDDPRLGGIATWWRAWYGTPMVAGDHKKLLPGEPAEVKYSYYWFVKMYWAVGPDGVLVGSQQAQHQVSSIRFPSQLMVQRCFLNHGNEANVFSGMQSSFIDAHAAWVPVEHILPSGAPWYGSYNLDWTLWGIYGKDVE